LQQRATAAAKLKDHLRVHMETLGEKFETFNQLHFQTYGALIREYSSHFASQNKETLDHFVDAVARLNQNRTRMIARFFTRFQQSQKFLTEIEGMFVDLSLRF